MVRRRLDLLVSRVVGQTRHPGKQYREGLLIQLLATTELLRRRSADPADRAVARERAGRICRPVAGGVGADELPVPYKMRHAQRLPGIARGNQSHGLLVQVAAPHPMVAVVQLVPIREVAPRRCESRDAGTAERLVFSGVQGHRPDVIRAATQGVRRHAGRCWAQPVDVVVPATRDRQPPGR